MYKLIERRAIYDDVIRGADAPLPRTGQTRDRMADGRSRPPFASRGGAPAGQDKATAGDVHTSHAYVT